jgi:hypothetical protein
MAGSASATALSGQRTRSGDEPGVRVAHLLDLDATLAPAQRMLTASGLRVTGIVRAGTFTGDRIHGTVLPGSGDSLLIDGAGIGHVDVRITLQITDGPLVHVTYLGRLVLPDDGLTRLAGGETLPDEEVYFRTAPLFEVEPGPYDWLNRLLAVGVGQVGRGRVRYQVYEIL